MHMYFTVGMSIRRIFLTIPEPGFADPRLHDRIVGVKMRSEEWSECILFEVTQTSEWLERFYIESETE